MAAGFLTREQAYKIVMDGRDRLLVPKGNGYVGVEAVEREGGPITSGPIPMILQLTIFCIDPNVKPEKQIESDRTESF